MASPCQWDSCFGSSGNKPLAFAQLSYPCALLMKPLVEPPTAKGLASSRKQPISQMETLDRKFGNLALIPAWDEIFFHYTQQAFPINTFHFGGLGTSDLGHSVHGPLFPTIGKLLTVLLTIFDLSGMLPSSRSAFISLLF